MKFVKPNMIACIAILACIMQLSACISRLPMYIGRGYDVLRGNPLSADGIDPGF